MEPSSHIAPPFHPDAGDAAIANRPSTAVGPAHASMVPQPPSSAASARDAAAPPNGRYRVLVVDDHPIFRDGLRFWLDRQSDLCCCGEAETVASALRAIALCPPDLVLLDLRLRAEEGLDAIRTLRRQHPRLPILALAHADELTYGDRALRAGARGFILKEQGGEELLTAVRTVLRGEPYVSRRLATHLLKTLTGHTPGGDPAAVLSNRELQVFKLLGSGVGTRRIAARLGVSIKTVEAHREHIKRKLGLKDATSLVHAASRWMAGHPPATH